MSKNEKKKPKVAAIRLDDFLDIPEDEQMKRVDDFLRSISQPDKK